MAGEAQISFEVYGLKEALRELNRIDKSARMAITRDYKKVVKPVVDDAKAHVPSDAPLSGWDRKWTVKRTGFQMFPWDSRKAVSMVKSKVSGKRPKQRGDWTTDLAVFYIGWYGMANTVFDMTGRRRDSIMAQNLNAKWGTASRVLWPAYGRNRDTVEDEILRIVEDVAKATNRRLNVVPK